MSNAAASDISPRTIVGLGEALFDVYSDRTLLGGAPLNMAVHAQQLGNRGVVVSRIGDDALGQRVLGELRARGVGTDHIQVDPDRPTGTVVVELDDKGEPSYKIMQNVAWDAMQWDPDLENLARRTDAVCFGTLAQRDGQSRSTIQRFVESAASAIRLLDVNLRQNFYDRRILTRSLELCTAVKINAHELRVLADLLNLGANADAAAKRLLQLYPAVRWLALTRGAEGTLVYTPTGRFEGAAVAVTGPVDAVGAGDVTSASLLHGALRNWAWDRTLKLANTLGAFVASSPGATPAIDAFIKDLAAGR